MNTPHWLTSGGCPEVEARIGMHRHPKLYPSEEAALAECIRWNQWINRARPDSDAHYDIEPYRKVDAGHPGQHRYPGPITWTTPRGDNQ